MKKRLNSYLYTKGKYIWKEHAIIDEINEYLYAQGKYPTKITKEDLTDDYIEYVSKTNWYRLGYIKTSGIQDIKYVARRNNQAFKDDAIFVSYRGKITHEPNDFDYEGFPDYDICVSGSSIFKILLAAEKYSNYDISDIRKHVEEKQRWYKENHPEEYRYSFRGDDTDWFEKYK